MTDALDIPRNIDEAACLEILSGMARHKSYSETPGERALADHLVAVMRDMGLEAELGVVEGERMNAIGRWRGSGGGKSLMFNGHIDTNPVSEGWTVDPWGGLVDEEFICGIDVSNMKSGDAASLCAVKTLIDAGIKPRGDVVLTYVVGERQGGVGTMAAIRDGVKADYFIDSEPTDLQAVTTHAEPQPTGAITPPGFYGTDAGHLYAELGMEGIVCGPGDRYNTMPDEPVDNRGLSRHGPYLSAHHRRYLRDRPTRTTLNDLWYKCQPKRARVNGAISDPVRPVRTISAVRRPTIGPSVTPLTVTAL